MLIRNLPVSDPTGVLMAFGKRLGSILTYPGERKGKAIHDIQSDPSRSQECSSFGSSIPLSFHTEMAFHHVTPSFVLLFCVRTDPYCKTHLVEQYNIISRLTQKSLDTLKKPFFRIHPPISYSMMYEPQWKEILYHHSILSFADHCQTEFKTRGARESYRELIDICQKHKSSFILQDGDLLIINNKTQIHARSSYSPFSDRLLKRMYVI